MVAGTMDNTDNPQQHDVQAEASPDSTSETMNRDMSSMPVRPPRTRSASVIDTMKEVVYYMDTEKEALAIETDKEVFNMDTEKEVMDFRHMIEKELADTRSTEMEYEATEKSNLEMMAATNNDSRQRQLHSMKSYDSMTVSDLSAQVACVYYANFTRNDTDPIFGSSRAKQKREEQLYNGHKMDTYAASPSEATGSKEWMQHDRPRNWKLYLEAIFASLVVIGLVVAVVFLTQPKKGDDDTNNNSSSAAAATSTPTSIPEPNSDDVPTGKSFDATFTLNGDKCSNPCRLSSGGLVAGVSQNLYGESAVSWSCGTCWQLLAETDSDGIPIANSSAIIVSVQTICPATPGNDLCMQKDLGTDSKNVHGGVVNFNLCPGADDAMFGDSGVGLGIGTATRVDCVE